MTRIATPAVSYSGASGGAEFDQTSAYRYWLWRRVAIGNGGRTCLFVMANPSTADSYADDPTIRRCVGFARNEGFDLLEVVNLFALRATRPGDLASHPDPVGPDNNDVIRERAGGADAIVYAWGAIPKGAYGRAAAVGGIVREVTSKRPRCLGVTKDGHPRHPLFVPTKQRTYPWPGR